MSNNDEEPYSSIFASLKHPVRRKILRMLSKKPMSYSEMLEVLGVSNSFLTYHLENLGELVGKMDDGRYRLSTFGEDAMATMIRVEDIPVNTSHQSPQTKPKKILWKSVSFAFGLICIVLIAFTAYFAVTGISAQNSYNNLQNQYNNLNSTYNNYVSTHSHTNAEYDAMWMPELILIDLTTINHTLVTARSNIGSISFWNSWLNVTGYLVNIHKNDAYNCTLHVVAISYNATALDSYINLGTISGESWANVGPNLYNVWGYVSNYTITPQWTASP